MAFGFRKTVTAVKKAGELDRYLIRKNDCTPEKSVLLLSERIKVIKMHGAGGGYNMKLIINGGLSIKARFLENILDILRYLYHTHSYIQYANHRTQSVKHKS